jgi:hypothetical protein
MTIFDKLTEDMKTALKAGEKDRLSAIRLLRGMIKNAAIDKQEDLSEDEEMAILNSAAKKRRESIHAYESAGRTDLAEKEQKELNVILTYLPQPLSSAELEKMVDDAIDEVDALTMKDMGKVMPVVIKNAKGRADGKTISELVKKKLS